MRTPLDFESEPGLKSFSAIVSDVLNNNLATITKSPPEIVLSEANHCAPADLTAEYMDGIIIQATEGKTGFEIGLLFQMEDITALADLMLTGEGEAKAELDNNLKDAVMEFSNQFFGGLVVPIESQLGKKLQFRVDSVTSVQSSDFQSDTYIAMDFMGVLNGDMQFRLYADDGFSSILENKSSGAQAQTFSTDFFSSGSSHEAPSRQNYDGTNMEMLLDIEIPISVRMGSAKLFLKDILGLGPGNIVELDQNADDSIELTVNDKLIARGEVVIVDGYFGFRIKEIISKAERIKRLKD
jgi:flagellar motor switch protein FliN/FliY